MSICESSSGNLKVAATEEASSAECSLLADGFAALGLTGAGCSTAEAEATLDVSATGIFGLFANGLGAPP